MRRQATSVRGILVLLPIGALLLACSGHKAVELPPQSLNEAADRDFGEESLELSEAEEGSAEADEDSSNNEKSKAVPVAEVASAAAQPSDDDDDESVVVIGEGSGDEAEPANPLIAASMAERRRRQTAAAAVAVITDKNLAEFAEGGKVTFAEPPPGGVTEAEEAVDDSAHRTDEELYWRTRVRSLRAEWRRNTDLIAELEAQAEDLRRRFYAEDDPYIRDRRIKPEWDRTLDRLDEARRAVARSREQLAEALEEGRRAGALPGWLRDGVELEPEPEVEEETPELDPEEPKVIDP